jgi:cell division transport system permease protein
MEGRRGVNISFALRLYLSNLQKNLGINFMAIGIIGLALLILGLFLLVGVNLNAVVKRWGEQIQISAYLKEGLDATLTDKVKRKLLAMEEVLEAEYVSKDTALERFRVMLKSEADLLKGIEGNPLPPSFEIRLAEDFRTMTGVEKAAQQIAAIQEVNEVSYGREWLGNFLAIIRLIKLLTAVVGTLILAAAVFIIYNTIKLTMYSRTEEIGIMKLVGATDFFIRLPFLFEGVTQGMTAALLSLFMLWITFAVVIKSLNLPFSLLAGSNPMFLPLSMILGLVIAGAALGVVGSMASFKDFIKV